MLNEHQFMIMNHLLFYNAAEEYIILPWYSPSKRILLQFKNFIFLKVKIIVVLKYIVVILKL